MKPYKTNKANIGDIIRAEEFAFGIYDHKENAKGYLVPDKKNITVDGKTKDYELGYMDPESKFRDVKYLKVDLGAYSPSRGKAPFVVEEAVMEGGGTGHGYNDVYPDGWHIIARRLLDDNTYNPKGELIQFYQSGCFNCMVKEVEVVGKMQRTFVSK